MRATQYIHYLQQPKEPVGKDLWVYTHLEITPRRKARREQIHHPHPLRVECSALLQQVLSRSTS